MKIRTLTGSTAPDLDDEVLEFCNFYGNKIEIIDIKFSTCSRDLNGMTQYSALIMYKDTSK